MYKSIFRYFHNAVPPFRRFPNTVDGFKRFADDPWKYTQYVYDRNVTQTQLWFFFRNVAMWDNGFPEFASDTMANNDQKRVRKAVHEIIERFDEILITEHLDESLILLGERLCWSLDDIIEFRQNIEVQKEDKHNKLTSEQKDNLIKFNAADHELYNVALHIFNRKRKAYGEEKMKSMLQQLRRKRFSLMERCTVGNKPIPGNELRDGRHIIISPPGVQIGGWKLKHRNDTYIEVLKNFEFTKSLHKNVVSIKI